MSKNCLSPVMLCFVGFVNAEPVDLSPPSTPINPDRRDFTTGTSIVPLGWVQVESGATWEREPNARDWTLGEVNVRVPLSRQVELHFGLPSYLISKDSATHSGFDNAQVELRYKFLDSKTFDMAMQLTAVLPTGDAAVAERKLQPGAILASTVKLSKSVDWVMSVGGTHASSDGVRYPQAFVATSLRHATTERIGLFVEGYAFNREQADGHAHRYAALGAVFLVNQDLALDGRIGKGFGNGNGVNMLISAGLSRRF